MIALPYRGSSEHDRGTIALERPIQERSDIAPPLDNIEIDGPFTSVAVVPLAVELLALRGRTET
jgi:hypothetical protein